MGGRMALRFAAPYPAWVRSRVLADRALDGQRWSEDWQIRWKGMCDAAKSGQLAEAKRLWLEHPLFDRARANPGAASLLSRMVGHFSGWHGNRDSSPVPAPSLAERLGQIRVPSLVMIGEHDLADFRAVVKTLEAGLPIVRLVVIENSGHRVNLEASRELNAAVLAFRTS